ncbi:MAG: mechanosensitive ion channel family protein [Prochloraceae cyanobacterium]|nr:mechanosensitive ion channel family protein [Prochloraceae cyanobacterium]
MSFDFLELEFLDNTVSDYLIALATLLLGAIVIKIVLNLILNRLKRWARKTATSLDNAIIRIFESNLIPIFYLGIFNLAVSNLTLNPILKQAIDPLTIILATILGIRFCVALAEYFLLLYSVTHNENNPNLKQSLNALIPAIKVLIWAVGIVFILDNLGFDISAVVASLGIGGVAIALASQGVLKDLFSYFSILFDRPFEIGDFIVVGDFLGTVEQVGIKTTRLKSIGGEELILANTDLTDSRIRNFKKMQQRRIVFKISVAYTTSLEALQEIPDLIENIVKETENVIFDRVHFNSYGDFSLDFETVYFVATSDYKDYMDAQQQINLRIKQEFEKRAIEFAYTTRVWQKLMQSESLN